MVVSCCACPIGLKGGTGKSTSTLDIGILLAQSGYNILIIDTDPQGAMMKTLTDKEVSLLYDREQFYKDYVKKPVETTSIDKRYFSFSKAVELDLSFFPSDLLRTEEYRKGFYDTIKSLLDNNAYNFVLLDSQGYYDLVGDMLINIHPAFDKIMPLIVTGATKQELGQGIETYILLQKMLDESQKTSDEIPQITEKLDPLIIMNKCPQDVTDFYNLLIEKKNSRPPIEELYGKPKVFESIDFKGKHIASTVKALNRKIPVFALPNQELSSATSESYSFKNRDRNNEFSYFDPDYVEPNEAILDLSKVIMSSYGFGSPDSGPSREKILEEKRCNDAKNYLDSIDMIAAYIENRLRKLDNISWDI